MLSTPGRERVLCGAIRVVRANFRQPAGNLTELAGLPAKCDVFTVPGILIARSKTGSTHRVGQVALVNPSARGRKHESEENPVPHGLF